MGSAAAQGLPVREWNSSEVASDGETPPMPKNNPGTWVTPADYPKWALTYGVEGVVRFRVEINAEGTVQSCEVTESSGATQLDDAACAKIVERGQFIPAKNKAGQNVPSYWVSAVRWMIPQKNPPPPGEHDTLMEFVVEENGKVTDCTVLRSEGLSDVEVGRLCANGEFPNLVPIKDADGWPQRTKVSVSSTVRYESAPD